MSRSGPGSLFVQLSLDGYSEGDGNRELSRICYSIEKGSRVRHKHPPDNPWHESTLVTHRGLLREGLVDGLHPFRGLGQRAAPPRGGAHVRATAVAAAELRAGGPCKEVWPQLGKGATMRPSRSPYRGLT